MRVSADAQTALGLGLDDQDLRDILTSCDRSRPAGDAKGFWRVDKDKPAELRQTVLTMVAFSELQSQLDLISTAGRVRQLGRRERDDGWFLPEKLRLADYQLGEGERARNPQPVASRLGPRFHDWQLAQSVDESWVECNLHARNLLGLGLHTSFVVAALTGQLTADEARAHVPEGTHGDAQISAGTADTLRGLRSIKEILPADVSASVADRLRDGGDTDEGNHRTLLRGLGQKLTE